MAYRKLVVDPRNIRKVQRQFNRLVELELRAAMVRLAQFGHAQVVKYTTTARPRPYATGAFAQGWVWARTADGAILWNSAKHGVFVELGRRPGGRPPPLQVILDWLEVKGLTKKASRVKRGKRKRPKKAKTPKGPRGKMYGPKAPKMVRYGPKKPRGPKLDPALREAFRAAKADARAAERSSAAQAKQYAKNERKLMNWAKRETAKATSRKKALEATAWAIAHKIARDGIKGRPVMARAWPSIVKRAPKEIREALKAAVRKVKPQ